MADPAKAGRLAVYPGQQEDAVRRHQVGWRSSGDLLVEVDAAALAVIDKRPVGLADELGVELPHPRIVSVDRVEGESHGADANALQNFFILRAMRTVTPGRIPFVTEKELSAVLTECAARTEIARAGVEEATRKQEAAIAKHEAVAAEQKALTATLEKERAEADARWQEESVVMRREAERRNKLMEESSLETRAIIAELKEHRDERRALIEAIFRVIDRLDGGQTRSS